MARARARFKAGKGRAATTFGGVPWREPGKATGSGTFNRGTPAAPGVTPAPALGPQAQPIDPIFDAQMGSANRSFSQTIAGLGYQRGQLGSIYGLGINAQGVVVDDPSNPFSRAAAYQQLYDRSVKGTRNSMAARGQLYAGSLQNAQNENARMNTQRRDALIREFMAAQQSIAQRELAAQGAYQDAEGSARAEAIQRAIQNRPDAASVPGPPPKPKAGFRFVMTTGPRAGMSYNLVPGKGPQKGKLVRQYEDNYREAR